MPDYRNIHTEFWTDDWILELDPLDKILFIYLFSNTRTNLAGLYDIGVRVMAFETGLDEKHIFEALDRFAAAGKAYYQDGVMWVPNLPIRNAYNIKSPKIVTNITTTMTQFRDCELKQRAIEYWNHTIAPRYDIDTISCHTYISDHINHITESGEPDATEEKPPEPAPEPSVVTFADWHQRVEQATNKPAAVREMFETLYPGRDPPDYGYIAKTAKRVGGYGRLAELLWQHSTKPPTGDVLAYVQTVSKHRDGKRTTVDSGKYEDVTPAWQV